MKTYSTVCHIKSHKH